MAHTTEAVFTPIPGFLYSLRRVHVVKSLEWVRGVKQGGGRGLFDLDVASHSQLG